MARLKHEAIGVVYQVGRLENGWPFTVSEYVAGEPLANVRGGLDLTARRLVVLSTLSALAFAEEHGVLHGDLHDRNVIYDGDVLSGRSRTSSTPVSLIDFGTSGFAGRDASAQRHARLLREFVFLTWPELHQWLRPLSSLERHVGLKMLPILRSATMFVHMVERDREGGTEVGIAGLSVGPNRPTDAVVLGVYLANLVDFDINHVLERLAQAYSPQELAECRRYMLFGLAGNDAEGLHMDSQLEFDRALNERLSLYGQELNRRWLKH